MPKILNFISSIDPNRGGTTVAVKNLCFGLSYHAVESEIVSLGGVHRVFHNNLGSLSIDQVKIFYPLEFVVYLLSVVRSSSSVVIHCHGVWCRSVWLVLLISRVLKVKTVFSPHGMLNIESFGTSKLKKKIVWNIFLKYMIAAVDLIVVNSDKEKSELKFFLKHCNIEVVPHFIVDNPDADNNLIVPKGLPCLNQFDTKLLFLGRVDRIKRIEKCIEVLAFLKCRRTCLVIAGPIDVKYKRDLDNLISKSHLGSQVFFIGPVDQYEKNYLFSVADSLLLMSKQENFGLVVLEALLQGCPVVVSPYTPWGDLEENLLGVSTDDVVRIASFLKKSTSSHLARSSSFISHSRKYCKQFDRKVVIEHYLSITLNSFF